MAVIGKRPRRVNNDGKSITRLGIAKVALLPGSFAVLDATGEFIQATAPVKPLYIVNVDDKQGEDILTAVVATESATCDFVEQGRQFAALVKAATACVLDTPLKLSATLGILEKATAPEDVVVAYSMEIYTTPAGAATHVRVRIA
jgi:hypothetical protein